MAALLKFLSQYRNFFTSVSLVVAGLILLLLSFVVSAPAPTSSEAPKTPRSANGAEQEVATAQTVANNEATQTPATNKPAQTNQPGQQPNQSSSNNPSNPSAPAPTQPTTPSNPGVVTGACTIALGSVTTTEGFGLTGVQTVSMSAGCTTSTLTIQIANGTASDWLVAWGGFEWSDGVQEKPLAPVVAVLNFPSTAPHNGSSLSYTLRSRADAAPGDYEVAFFVAAADAVYSVRVTVL